jgi:hypothetical protein
MFILITGGARGAARGTVRTVGLKKSKRVEEHSRDTRETTYVREEEEDEDEEEGEDEEEVVLDSSHSTSIAPQPPSISLTKQSTTRRSSSQQSAMSIDPVDNREIIRRSRSHTPQADVMSSTSTQSRRSTPIVEQPIVDLTQSQHSTPMVRRVSSDDRSTLNNIEALLIKQGKQIRALYEMQKSSLEKISSLQTQVKKLSSDKNNELSSKVFNVSNNLDYRI